MQRGAMKGHTSPDYMFDPSKKPALKLFDVPLIKATAESVREYGCLVNDPDNFEIEIVQWPAQGWRHVDLGTGNEAGYVEGIFHGEWKNEILYGSNEAVNGEYVLGWSATAPWVKSGVGDHQHKHVVLWHMNYHPDGGQLFYPLDQRSFVVPVALPGDDLAPHDVVAFWFDGSCGFYVHPNIWHDGIFPTHDRQRFLDRQGRVHARVSCDFGQEFKGYLSVPIPKTL